MKLFNIPIDKLGPIKLIIFILVPMLILLYASDYLNDRSFEILLFFLGVYVVFIYYFWLWMIGKYLIFLSNTKHKRLFHIACMITMFVLVIQSLIVMYYIFNASEYHESIFTLLNLKLDELMLDEWNWILNISIGYISYFLAKNIREIEEGRSLRFSKYFGIFLLIFFLPVINIFIIQPRIKKMSENNK